MSSGRCPAGAGLAASSKTSSLAIQAWASASSSAVAPVPMISAMVTSSPSPTALITSSRVRFVMASLPSSSGGVSVVSRNQPNYRNASSVAAWSNRLFLRHLVDRVLDTGREADRAGCADACRNTGCAIRQVLPAGCRRSRGCFIPGILAIAGLPRTGGAGGIRYPRRAAAVVHHGIETVALFLETRHQWSLERAASRQLDAHRIDETAVDQNFIMDVGAGRHARRSDEADHLALPHPLARLHALGVGRHVAVGGLVAVVVLQADVFAVTPFPADLFDAALAGGENRRAIWRGSA